ncbi:DUF2000 domain-containing protein [Nocardioides sp. CER19]|uniref:DUF2000 domain-containing protein n=1 Tax=Nocardioides sp. CER19 TaxID=3038538 RepID=UPI00244AA340|nr:DUF2000 domain-containing protein [Nocardioides sp. CER19]MDH2413893.1 DUF2000 domain-containing protein [Nocardioides sp. CER19]
MNKIVVVLRDDLPPAHAANAAVVLGLALGGRLTDSVAAASPDASGALHAGLNPIPVPTLVASAEQLRDLHHEASAVEDAVVVGFNEVARRSRTYPDYVDALATTEPADIDYVGVIVVGPRSTVTKLTKRLALLS